MQKWEEEQQKRALQQRLKNAKAVVSLQGTRKSGTANKPQKQLNEDAINSYNVNSNNNFSSNHNNPLYSSSSKSGGESSSNKISDYYEFEKNNLPQIPLFKLLKFYGLQQYARELISRGYGYDISKLAYLSKDQLNDLLSSIKVVSGHKTKLMELFLDMSSKKYFPEIEGSLYGRETPPQSHDNCEMHPTLDGNGQQQQSSSSSGFALTKAPSMKGITSTKNSNSSNNFKHPSSLRQDAMRRQSEQNLSQELQLQLSQQQQHMLEYEDESNHNANQKRITMGFGYFGEDGQEDDELLNEKAMNELVSQYAFAKNKGVFKEKDKEDNKQVQEQIRNSLNHLKDEIHGELTREQTTGIKDNTQQKTSMTDKSTKQGQQVGMTSNSQRSKGTATTSTNTSSTGSNVNQAAGTTATTKSHHNNNNSLSQPHYSMPPQQPSITKGFLPQVTSNANRSSSNKQVISNQNTLANTARNILASNPIVPKQLEPREQSRDHPIPPPQHHLKPKRTATLQPLELKEHTIKQLKAVQGDNKAMKSKSSESSRVAIQPHLQNATSISTKQMPQLPKSTKNANSQENANSIKKNVLDEQVKKQMDQIIGEPIPAERATTGSNKPNSKETSNVKSNLKDPKTKEIEQAQQKETQKKRKQQPTKEVLDDQCLISEFNDEDRLVTNFRQSKLVKNLATKISAKNDILDELNPQLEYETVKLMYMSFDSGKLTSTLINIDIEEMCFCFACAILKHIERAEQVSNNNSQHGGDSSNKSANDNANTNPKQLFYNNVLLHGIAEETEDLKGNENQSIVSGDFHGEKLTNKMKDLGESGQELFDELQGEQGMIEDGNESAQIAQNIESLKLLEQQQSAILMDKNSNSIGNGTNTNNMQQSEALWIKNDTTLNRTNNNPIEEPTMIHDEYNQSAVNQAAERYLKDEKLEEDLYAGKILIDPQQQQQFQLLLQKRIQAKKSLSDISERTQEVSHQQPNKSQALEESRVKQLEASRQMENFLKESMFLKQSKNEFIGDSKLIEKNDQNNGQQIAKEDENDENDEGDFNYKNQQLKSYQREQEGNNEDIKGESENDTGSNFNENLKRLYTGEDEEEQANEGDVVPGEEVQSEGEVEQAAGYPDENNGTFNKELMNQQYGEQDNYNNNYQEQSQQQLQNPQDDSNQMSFSMISRYSMVIPNDQESNQRLFDKTFTYRDGGDAIFTLRPTRETIQNYAKNVCLSCQLEKQIPIIALVYIERLLEKSKQVITPKNWRKITLTSMIMASKIWDDESFENKNFAQAFPAYSVVQINEMERVFLNFIDYNLYIKGADYAKYYFILREFAQKNKKSFPLRPLDLKTILYLQNNANRAQSNLREIYQNPLNKSF